MKLNWRSKYFQKVVVALAILLMANFFFVTPAKSQCQFTDGPNERVAARILMNIGGIAMLIPGLQIGGAVIAGIGMGWDTVLMFNNC